MKEFSVLIGGKAGFGIDKSGTVITEILNQNGYRIYEYRDYPSLIRGGHTFSIIRACERKISAHRDKVDFILALNQDTVDIHKTRLKDENRVIFDSDLVKSAGLGAPLGKIIQEEQAPEIMRNTSMIGCFCKAAGIDWDILEGAFKKTIPKELDLNLKVARRGFDAVSQVDKIERLGNMPLNLINGNDALGMGLLKGGLKAYIAYPMTPSSGLLHFMAAKAKKEGIKTIHPESEISVMLMALGFAYAGRKVAVGTSGGGFCLMTEGLSFSGMAELPIVIVLGQRPGPSTGLPTYTAQTELHFAMRAGQGEFPRLIVAPGDAEEAYYWSIASLNLAWKYQIPAIILSDKNLAEETYSFDENTAKEMKEEPFLAWDGKGSYRRYEDTADGVSPMAFCGAKNAIVKVNSYEHDESGITTEDPLVSKKMQDKRLKKAGQLSDGLKAYNVLNIYGNKDSSTALLCWGSNKGVCAETAENFRIKAIHLQLLWPFPLKQLEEALNGVTRLILVENNATGQLADLIKLFGLKADSLILKYDGRPFSIENLEEELRKILR